MADLTPDEVMAMHVKYEFSTGEITFCQICDDECPCETYLMAERAKTAEARVTALEAVVDMSNQFVASVCQWLYKDEQSDSTEAWPHAYWEGYDRAYDQINALVDDYARAVELMEGE